VAPEERLTVSGIEEAELVLEQPGGRGAARQRGHEAIDQLLRRDQRARRQQEALRPCAAAPPGRQADAEAGGDRGVSGQSQELAAGGLGRSGSSHSQLLDGGRITGRSAA
jgi:hypothetical protein